MNQIRLARLEEAEKICGFYHDVIDALTGAEYTPCWERDVFPLDEDLRAYIECGEMYVGGDEAISCSMALTTHEDRMEIHVLAVHPDARGAGFGRKLVRFAQETAVRKGLGKICLDVTEGNLPAEKLYTSMGFTYVKTRRDWYAEDDYLDFREFEYKTE